MSALVLDLLISQVITLIMMVEKYASAINACGLYTNSSASPALAKDSATVFTNNINEDQHE